MNLTIEQIIDEIITEVGADTEDSTFVSLILGFFKVGLRKFPAFARDRLLLTNEELTLSVNTNSIDLTSLTSQMLKEIAIWYVNSQSNRIPIDKPVDRSYFNEIYNSNGTGTPLYYVINGKTIYFDKLADQEYTIGIEYFKEISNVTTSDTFFGDERTLEAIKSLCKEAYYLDYEEDESKSARHGGIAREIIFELEADYEDQEQSGHIGQSNS